MEPSRARCCWWTRRSRSTLCPFEVSVDWAGKSIADLSAKPGGRPSPGSEPSRAGCRVRVRVATGWLGTCTQHGPLWLANEGGTGVTWLLVAISVLGAAVLMCMCVVLGVAAVRVVSGRRRTCRIWHGRVTAPRPGLLRPGAFGPSIEPFGCHAHQGHREQRTKGRGTSQSQVIRCLRHPSLA